MKDIIPKYFTVYFTAFGRKLKTKVLAMSPEQAKQKVIQKITFDKIEEVPFDGSEKGAIDALTDFLGV